MVPRIKNQPRGGSQIVCSHTKRIASRRPEIAGKWVDIPTTPAEPKGNRDLRGGKGSPRFRIMPAEPPQRLLFPGARAPRIGYGREP
jgi:hypothetical protein